jgi:nitrite reductase/ring-hydroxylating ferredoxin subunit
MATEFKLKDLKSIDLKPGEKREVEVDGIEDGKVLLVNVGGKTTALGARCTHYGKTDISSNGHCTLLTPD